MRLVFSPAESGRCHVVVHRQDGATLRMRSYDSTFRVPHDLAHAVAERELGLRAGVFGCIAAGVVFSSMHVLDGSARHGAAARSARILKANKRSIAVAESLSGVFHRAAEGSLAAPLFLEVREAWGVLEERPFPYTEGAVLAAAAELEALAERWTALPPGGVLEVPWPRRLTAPVPAARR